MASASTLSTNMTKDLWRPRRTRRLNYQSHTYKLRTPVVRMEQTSHEKEVGMPSVNPHPELLHNYKNDGSISVSTTLNPTNQVGKNVKSIGMEAEDVLNSEISLHLQDKSVRTLTTSPIREQQSLETGDLDILAISDRQHSQRHCKTSSPYVPLSRQQQQKRQTQLRKQASAKKSCSVTHKPTPAASKNKPAMSGEPVKVKLWEPANMVRERKHLNELDICLSVYDQVLQDMIDEEHRPAIKEVLLRHMKMTQKSFLVTIKEAHMLQLIQKRHKMEKTRQRKLRRSMESTFKGLRKGAKQLLMKKEYLERSKQLQLDDLDQESDDDLFKQLKSLLAPFDTQGMFVSGSQSIVSQ